MALVWVVGLHRQISEDWRGHFSLGPVVGEVKDIILSVVVLGVLCGIPTRNLGWLLPTRVYGFIH